MYKVMKPSKAVEKRMTIQKYEKCDGEKTKIVQYQLSS